MSRDEKEHDETHGSESLQECLVPFLHRDGLSDQDVKNIPTDLNSETLFPYNGETSDLDEERRRAYFSRTAVHRAFDDYLVRGNRKVKHGQHEMYSNRSRELTHQPSYTPRPKEDILDIDKCAADQNMVITEQQQMNSAMTNAGVPPNSLVYVIQRPVMVTTACVVPDYICFSAMVMLCWCLPLGLFALHYANAALNLAAKGKRQKALNMASRSKYLNYAGVAIGLIFDITGTVIFLVVWFKTN